MHGHAKRCGSNSTVSIRCHGIINISQLPSLKGFVLSVFACLEDRNPGVRKAAQDLLPVGHVASYSYMSDLTALQFVVANVGMDKIKAAAGKLSPSSKNAVMPFIDKVQVPTKAAPAGM